MGTTFTLDLTAALMVPLAFGARTLGPVPDPVGVMEAVRGAADRVDVFYQAGQASVPAQASDVMAFLEPVVHPVTAPRAGHLFHPKVWLLKYAGIDGEVSFRFVCSSRNLTHDRSWDMVVSLDGVPGRTLDAANEPLRRFVQALPDMCTHALPAERRQAVLDLADEARRVVWDRPDGTKDLAFHAFGIPGPAARPDFSGYRRLVVSPFVEAGGLDVVAPTSRDTTVLVSRPQQMDQLEPLPEGLELRALSVMAQLEEERVAGELSGLHAKMVLVERSRRAHVFLGSANATGAAFGGNVEFLVEIVRGAKQYGVDSHLDAVTGFGLLLEPYTQQPVVEDRDEQIRYALQSLLRRLASRPWSVTVRGSGPAYSLDVGCPVPAQASTARVTVELATRRGESAELQDGVPPALSLSDIALADITPFLVLTAEQDGVREATVVPATLVGDPDDRLDAVLARQVDTPDKFLRFLLLVLGLGGAGGAAAPATVLGGAGSWSGTAAPALFELLARSLAEDPEALRDLAGIVERLSRTEAGRAVLPPGFSELWTTVQQAQRLLGAAP